MNSLKVQDLLDRMTQSFAPKQASSVETVVDPSAKPAPSVEGDPPAETLPQAADNSDKPTETVPGGMEPSKVGEGAPSAETKPFEEQGKAAADRLERMRAKLAALAQPAPEPKPAEAAPAAEPKQAAAEAAPEPQGESQQLGFFHMKVAEHLLETERGRALVEDAIAEINGVNYAQDLLKKAAEERALLEQAVLQQQFRALEEAEMAKQAAAQQQELAELWKQASAEDRQEVETSRRIIEEAGARLEAIHPMLKMAFDAGTADAAAYDEMAEGDPAAAEAAMAGGMEGAPTPEELVAVLEQLVAEGKVSPEEAQQILDAITGSGGMPGAEDPEAMKEAAARQVYLEKVASIVDSIMGGTEPAKTETAEPAKA